LSPALCMTLSSVDLGLPPWEIVGILTAGLALSSFALSGSGVLERTLLIHFMCRNVLTCARLISNSKFYHFCRTLLYASRYVS
jgi:hypothetical protein